jgi:hypothetical protein
MVRASSFLARAIAWVWRGFVVPESEVMTRDPRSLDRTLPQLSPRSADADHDAVDRDFDDEDDTIDHDDEPEPAVSARELARALGAPIAWLFDFVDAIATDDDDEAAAVTRVRAAVRAWQAGRPFAVRFADALTVIGILIGSLDPSVLTTTSGVVALRPYIRPIPVELPGAGDPDLSAWFGFSAGDLRGRECGSRVDLI